MKLLRGINPNSKPRTQDLVFALPFIPDKVMKAKPMSPAWYFQSSNSTASGKVSDGKATSLEKSSASKKGNASACEPIKKPGPSKAILEKWIESREISVFPHRAWTAHLGPVTGLTYIMNPASIASCSPDGSVRVWSLAGRPIGVLASRPPREVKVRVPGIADSDDEEEPNSGSAKYNLDKSECPWDFKIDAKHKQAIKSWYANQVLKQIESPDTSAGHTLFLRTLAKHDFLNSTLLKTNSQRQLPVLSDDEMLRTAVSTSSLWGMASAVAFHSESSPGTGDSSRFASPRKAESPTASGLFR